ncbi:hypothetical protein [Legionella longbeachae]|uniref:hypothetical protein n=2 Tax=Legionella longbeachae TaxID=450 RepID=UPI000563954C
MKPEDIIYLGDAAYSEFKNTIIWRYMDCFKFESLLSESKLYLCRLDQFEDFDEGTLTKANQVSLSSRSNGIDEKQYIR